LIVTNEEVLSRVNVTLFGKGNLVDWTCFETRRTSAPLHEITEDRMRGKLTTGRRIQMLHDLANDSSFVALKRAAEDRERYQ